MALTESVHELLELGSALDLEEDLVVVVRDLDIEMLRCLLLFRLVAHGRAVVLVRHCGEGLESQSELRMRSEEGGWSCVEERVEEPNRRVVGLFIAVADD